LQTSSAPTAKKPWRKPIVKTLKAGAAEHGANPGNDGNGGHTGS
jgi:hypothetical protein